MGGLADALGASLVLRIIVPGSIAMLGVHPFVSAYLLKPLGNAYGVSPTVAMLVEVAVLGLLLQAAARPIYFVYEGYLFRSLFRPSVARYQERVDRKAQRYVGLLSDDAKTDEEQQEQDLLGEYLADFPVEGEGDQRRWVASCPTRLGNIVATYEGYVESRYGLPGWGFWWHVRLLASEEARKDFDESLRFAESLVLGSVASMLLVAVGSGVVLAAAVVHVLPAAALAPAPFGMRFAVGLALGGMALVWLTYRLALHAHREAAYAFRAMADLTMPALEKWILECKVPLPQPVRDRAADVWEYLDNLAPLEAALPDAADRDDD